MKYYHLVLGLAGYLLISQSGFAYSCPQNTNVVYNANLNEWQVTGGEQNLFQIVGPNIGTSSYSVKFTGATGQQNSISSSQLFQLVCNYTVNVVTKTVNTFVLSNPNNLNNNNDTEQNGTTTTTTSNNNNNNTDEEITTTNNNIIRTFTTTSTSSSKVPVVVTAVTGGQYQCFLPDMGSWQVPIGGNAVCNSVNPLNCEFRPLTHCNYSI